MMDYADNIQRLRAWMRSGSVQAVLIPTDDPHMSEYPAERFKVREYFSGFKGSAGMALILPESGYLWTDGRYYIQAEKEIAPQGLTLMRMGDPRVPDVEKFLVDTLQKGDVVAIDGAAFPIKAARALREKLLKAGITMQVGGDFVEAVWTSGRPALPSAPADVLAMEYAGRSTMDKITELREKMKKAGARHYVVASLDDVAWLMNMRGDDISQFPVTYAYALIGMDNAYLFIDRGKPSEALREALQKNGVALKDYEEIGAMLREIPAQECVLVDPERVNYFLSEQIHAPLVFKPELTAAMKACKNDAELECMRRAHIIDGACMVRLLLWVDQQRKAGAELTELLIEEKVNALRKGAPGNQGLSFSTISAFGPHGAMMHYRATEQSNAPIGDGLMVLDSGGQYIGATTDITRTLVFGVPTQQQKQDYTLTLQSHIAVITAKFLEGTGGNQIDSLARQPMWQRGMDYKSGTGHGVGAGLSVHEGPQRINTSNTVPLRPGMIVSDEPGVYRAGLHGIRIENLCAVYEWKKTDDGVFYAFECISWCPIETSAIDVTMLSDAEIEWLNDYHKTVYEKLESQLSDEEKAFLKEKTQPIAR